MTIEVVEEEFGDGSMLCTDHPYKNNTPAGGICAFCLQEKLDKLVSSSLSITIFPSSSSSSPSFRSDNFTTTTTTTTGTSSIVPVRTIPSSVLSNTHNERYHQHFKISKIPFLLTHKKKKKDISSNTDHNNNAMIFKRSKSTATPRQGHLNEIEDFSSHKRRFWSFRHFNKQSACKKLPEMKEFRYPSFAGAGHTGSFSRSIERTSKKEEAVVVEERENPDQVSADRKVSRSRSVGCGSRSFSGDFFERISTGLGDCTLRRVESHREGKSRARHGGGGQDCIKERVKCSGLFSGFMITSSSSSSSSSSYWVSSSTEDNNVNVKSTAAGAPVATVVHGRSKSWGWAFASPMRAFSKPSSAKRDAISAANKNAGPNLSAIPSLLAVRS